MNGPLVSIIIPCYNAEKYMCDTLNSLANQSYKNIQYIFVNDGSTDKTKSILESFCKTHKNGIIINQVNSGVSAARNNGIKHAKGEYICFCDADDIVHPYLISTLVDAMNNGSDLACCKFAKFRNNINFKKINPHSKCIENFDNVAQYSLKHWQYNFMLWNKMFKKSIIDKMQVPFDTRIRYSEDMVFFLKYVLYCNKATFISNKLYFYRMRNDSLTRQSITKHKVHYPNTIGITESLLKNFPKAQYMVKAHICECTRSLIDEMIDINWDKQSIINTYEIYKRNYKDTFNKFSVPFYKRINFKFSNLKTKKQMKKIIAC